MREPAEAGTDGHVMRREVLSGCLICLFTSVYLLPVVPLGLNPYDEGVRLYGADQVLAGHSPYYDFFAYYGPSEFYWPAILFKVLGSEIVVARLGAVVFIGVAAVAVFSLCRNAGLSRAWAAIPVAALVVPLRAGDELIICDPAMSLILAAGASLTGAWVGRRQTFGAGLLLGVAATFRPDFALYGTMAGLVVSLWVYRGGTETGAVTRWFVRPIWDLRVLVGGIASTAVPVYGFLAVHGPGRLVEALVSAPTRLMPFRTLPYAYNELPFLHAWISGQDGVPRGRADLGIIMMFITPLLGLLLALSLLDRRRRQRISTCTARSEALVFALVAAAGLGVYALGRGDWYHVYPLHVFAVLVASLILGSRSSREPRLIAIVIAVVAVAGVVLRIAVVTSGPLRAASPLSIPRARAIVVGGQLAWVGEAVRDIARYGRNGPILVAAQRHDRVHWNALILYFLSGRPSGTYFHDMIPGLTTTREVQERIVRDLKENHVRTVVIWKGPLPEEPNKSRVSSGVFVLDEYLESEFSPVRQTEKYDILVKRE